MARRETAKLGLEAFVCVRVVQMNSLDLASFQFDPGLTWAVLFMNADKTVYGRYGSRSRAEGSDDVSTDGFSKAVARVLELHRGYPGNKEWFAGKSGPAPRFAKPQGYPSLRDYPVVVDPARGERNNPSCIHCHQLQEAEYRVFRDAGRPIPDEVLWAWPMPDALGLSFDVNERATVKSVAAGSSAEKDGFRPGDEIVTLDGQHLVSIADVQWVLERAKDGAKLAAHVLRTGRRSRTDESLTLTLPPGWRKNGDFSWRDATRGAFRPDWDAKAEAGGLRVTRAAAGLEQDDLIVDVDGRRIETFSRFLAYLAQEKKPGDRMAVTVRRGGKDRKLELTAP